MVMANSGRADASALLGLEGMLLLTRPHKDCDVVVVCRGDLTGAAHKDVHLFCHRAVLQSTGGMFHGMRQFEQLSGPGMSSSSDVVRVAVPASEVVVFEVLRYLYCGAVFFPLGFQSRFAEFLNVVDYLGLVGSTAADAEAPQGIFADPSVQQLLREMSHTQLSALLQDGSSTLSFSVRRALLAAVGQLWRPTEEATDWMPASDDCHPAMAGLGSAARRHSGGWPEWSPDAMPAGDDWLWPGDALASSEAAPAAPAAPAGTEQRRLVNTDSMVFAHLRHGGGSDNVVAVF